MKILYIHGANATNRSFNFIREHLPKHESIFAEYDTDFPLSDTINSLCDRLIEEKERVNIISHSLGGVIALSVTEKCPKYVNKIVTMSTPFGGSMTADMLRWIYPQNQLYRDISTTGEVIRKLEKPVHDILSFVTISGGIPIITEPNDGVVTVKSQMKIDGINYKEVDANHFEVLLDFNVVDDIKKFLF